MSFCYKDSSAVCAFTSLFLSRLFGLFNVSWGTIQGSPGEHLIHRLETVLAQPTVCSVHRVFVSWALSLCVNLVTVASTCYQRPSKRLYRLGGGITITEQHLSGLSTVILPSVNYKKEREYALNRVSQH